MVDLDQEYWYQTVEHSVRQIQISRRVGILKDESGRIAETATCFLIAPDLVLTNYHVVTKLIAEQMGTWVVYFDFHKSPNKNEIKFTGPYLLQKDYLIGFCEEGQTENGDSYSASIQELDYAILHLQKKPGLDIVEQDGIRGYRGWFCLGEDYEQVKLGEDVILFQHPIGKPLCSAKGKTQSFNREYSRLKYKLKTHNGSSGSPCFREFDLKLVALHSGSYSDRYTVGIPISPIYNHIKETFKDRPDVLEKLDQKVPPPPTIQPEQKLALDIEDATAHLIYEEIKKAYVYSLPAGEFPKDSNISRHNMINDLILHGVAMESPAIVKFLYLVQVVDSSLKGNSVFEKIRNFGASWDHSKELAHATNLRQQPHDVIIIIRSKDTGRESQNITCILEMKVYHDGNFLHKFQFPSEIHFHGLEKQELQRAMTELWLKINALYYSVQIKIGIPVSLLNLDIAKLPLVESGLTLNQIGPISYFSLDRKNFPGALQRLHTRWKQISCSGRMLRNNNSHVTDLDKQLNHTKKIANQATYVSCLREISINERTQKEVIPSIFCSGVPAMIWTRNRRFPNRIFLRNIFQFDQRFLQQLPSELHNDGLSNEIAFLLDQPDYYSPEGFV